MDYGIGIATQINLRIPVHYILHMPRLGSGNGSLLPRKTIYYQSKVLIFIGKGGLAWLAGWLVGWLSD